MVLPYLLAEDGPDQDYADQINENMCKVFSRVSLINLNFLLYYSPRKLCLRGVYTQYYNSNLIWSTISHRWNSSYQRITRDAKRQVLSDVMG